MGFQIFLEKLLFVVCSVTSLKRDYLKLRSTSLDKLNVIRFLSIVNFNLKELIYLAGVWLIKVTLLSFQNEA